MIGLFVLGGMLAMALCAPVLAPHSLDWRAPDQHSSGADPETLEELAATGITHPAPPAFGSLTGDSYVAPLGTDDSGAGIFTQLLYGARPALSVGLAAGLLSTLVGVPIGVVSGYYGDSTLDEAIQRAIDVLYALPFLPLVIVFIAVNGPTTTNIILAIVFKAWLNNAIVVRGVTLSLSQRSFIDAARLSGASDLRIMGRHILPNVMPLAFVYLAQDAAIAVLIQANLAFLGLGDYSTVSWGTMLQSVRLSGHLFDALWWLLPPGVMITALAASFYCIGYSLEDVLNPHHDR